MEREHFGRFEFRWYVWVPAGSRDPADAEGIFGFNPGCAFFYNRNAHRWESDPDLILEFLGEGSPKVRVDRETAEKIARRFGTTLPDLSKGYPPRREDHTPP